MTSASTPSPPRLSVVRLLVVIFLSRTILNIAYRAVYPFLPFIAADLGVTVESAAQIIQSRNLVGLTAPLFGSFSDRYGRRAIMLVGLGISIVASLTLGFFNSFTFAIIAIAVFAFGKILYDPAQQAYVGDVVPYATRGRVMSISEISWSAAALIGLPLAAILLQAQGWRAVSVVIGIIAIGGFIITWFGLPREINLHLHHPSRSWNQTFSQILREPSALAVLVTALLNTASNENINVVFGAWMKNSFLMDAVALGTVASAIGLAELGGELFSSGFVDRIGKHRLVGAGLLLSGVAYALLPIIGQNALLGTLGLVLVFFLFEMAIVSALPLVTELVPGARGTLLSLNVAVALLGRTIGSFTGPFLFSSNGFLWNGLTSGAAMVVAFAVWHFLVRERG
jgi:predicted MFS family arabinose efflux permease